MLIDCFKYLDIFLHRGLNKGENVMHFYFLIFCFFSLGGFVGVRKRVFVSMASPLKFCHVSSIAHKNSRILCSRVISKP